MAVSMDCWSYISHCVWLEEIWHQEKAALMACNSAVASLLKVDIIGLYPNLSSCRREIWSSLESIGGGTPNRKPVLYVRFHD